MVDWDRVDELRARGRDWGDIASDPKVGFHPEASAGDPGRALKALYRRRGGGGPRSGPDEEPGPASTKATARDAAERRWGLARVGYLIVPAVAVWFALAYAIPSPVGLVVPAVPYLVLALAGAGFVLAYALWRNTAGRRWSKVYRNTAVAGAVVGLAIAGVIGLSAGVIFGCPYLPPSSRLGSTLEGWSTVPTSPWTSDGKPVVFFYGGTWCPYCSASSWAVWKALTEFGSVSGNYTSYSFPFPEPYAYTPEMVLANVHVGSSTVAVQVDEYAGTVDGQLSPTANCYQQAYVTAYDSCQTCGVPFIVLGGQYLHVGALYSPGNLSAWNKTNNASGAAFVESSVRSESGRPWQVVQGQAWAIMAFLARSSGQPVPTLAALYGWSPATKRSVWQDVNATS